MPAGLPRMAAGGAVVERAARLGPPLRRWVLRLLAVALVLVVVAVVLEVVVQIATNYMWFDSVRASGVYTTKIRAEVVLFVIFAVIAGAVGAFALGAVRRLRPALDFSADLDTFRWTFRRYEKHYGRLLTIAAGVIPAIIVGRQAAAGWQTYLLWANSKPFHTTDPTFHRDSSFFVEVYPFHQFVLSLLLHSVTYGLWIAAVAGYWYGGWRLRRGRQKVTSAMVRLMSLFAAVYLVLRAANYWESRYAITTSQRGPVTGAGYTDVTATLPATYVLMAVALLCAAALVVNALTVGQRRRVFGRVRGFAGAIAVMVVVALLAGTAWPGLVYHFREAPSAARLDLDEIANNQKATRAAFGLDTDIKTVGYSSSSSLNSTQLTQLASTTAQTPVIDPNQISPTFNVEQQLQAYYGFKSTLDISHYTIDGRDQDVALGARELRSSGIPGKSWVKKHLVYTHGYGVVATPTTTVNSSDESPVFLNGGMPPAQQIPVTRPQVYFGQAYGPGSYSLVGQPAGSKQNLEFDHPGGSDGAKSAHTTYRGDGGIPVGSTLRRLLFAVKLHDPNILFSSELNSASQLLTVRNPATRVAKVAPWLTTDGDVYPAVVDGRIKWIVDGYTTTSNYPDAQSINLHAATNTTLVAHGSSRAQASTQINYMHNSVKAVVDAYTGRVTLYEWNQKQQPDALLHAWESVYPHLVKKQSSIPSALNEQLRYPTDMFNVQRYLLAKYHVTKASSFYSGNDFWTVPTDPTLSATNAINANSSGGTSSAPLPSRYLSMSADGYGAQRYSLSSPMVTLNGHQLAAYVSVDSQPGPDYGKFTVLQFPSGASGEAPSQVQNDIESDTAITEALTLQRGGNSQVVLGGLVAVPLAGRILYVEPVYTKSTGGASFPVLRHVIALYGNGDPSFKDTLSEALAQAFRSASPSG